MNIANFFQGFVVLAWILVIAVGATISDPCFSRRAGAQFGQYPGHSSRSGSASVCAQRWTGFY